MHPEADTCTFMATIFELPPVIHCSTQTVHYGQMVTYDIAFEDDACPQAATWSILSGPGAIDPVSGQFTWTTACADVGINPVTVELSDGKGADTCTFDVVVTNTPPFVDCPADLTGLKVGVTVDLGKSFSRKAGGSTP